MKTITTASEEKKTIQKRQKIQRDSFVFYSSFYTSLDKLHGEEFEECVRALAEYALTGKKRRLTSSVSAVYFNMAIPQIDSNNRRYTSAIKGAQNRWETDDKAQQSSKSTANAKKSSPTKNVRKKGSSSHSLKEDSPADNKSNSEGECCDAYGISNSESYDAYGISNFEGCDAYGINNSMPNVNDNVNVNDNDNGNGNEKVNADVDGNDAVNSTASDNTACDINENICATPQTSPPQNTVYKNEESVNTYALGKHSNVFLNDDEYSSLLRSLGIIELNKRIEFLSGYISRKGITNIYHYKALNTWVGDAVKERESKSKAASSAVAKRFGFNSYEEIGFEQMFETSPPQSET